jgi:hypothetical protein
MVMRTKCISVRLESLVSISDKAYRATAFDGSSDIIPKSCVFGPDFEVSKCDAYWIAAWILQKKSIQYSHKKEALFDENGHQLPTISIKSHTPETITPETDSNIEELKR